MTDKLTPREPTCERVSEILRDALGGREPRYRTPDGHIRWGVVENDMHTAICIMHDAAPAVKCRCGAPVDHTGDCRTPETAVPSRADALLRELVDTYLMFIGVDFTSEDEMRFDDALTAARAYLAEKDVP